MFWLKLFYLTLILDNGIMEIPNFEFGHITLGHSGFLITWKPHRQLRYFLFASQIKDAKDNTFSLFVLYTKTIVPPHQYLIPSLKEDTLYEIIIYQYSNESQIPPEEIQKNFPPTEWETNYTLELKTNRKTNTKPAKPNFTHLQYPNRTDQFALYWLLCGREGKCLQNEAGTHFAVKLRVPHERGEYRFEEYENDRIWIQFIPGIPYEVTFVSINGDYETESDPQEIYVEPRFTTVRSLTAISFPNASILVSWKPPKYALETLTKYAVGIANESLTFDNQLIILKYSNILTVKSNFVTTNTTEKLFDKPKYQLKLGDTYIISIVPQGETGAGLEARIKHTLRINDDDGLLIQTNFNKTSLISEHGP